METTKNLTNISDMSEAVFDIYMRSLEGEDGIVCEHLSVAERAHLAKLWGWESSPWLTAWIAPTPKKKETGPDYEQLILARQERELFGE